MWCGHCRRCLLCASPKNGVSHDAKCSDSVEYKLFRLRSGDFLSSAFWDASRAPGNAFKAMALQHAVAHQSHASNSASLGSAALNSGPSSASNIGVPVFHWFCGSVAEFILLQQTLADSSIVTRPLGHIPYEGTPETSTTCRWSRSLVVSSQGYCCFGG